MKILAFALKELYTLHIGKVIFTDLCNLIKDIDNHDLTKAEKKAKVLADFKLIGYDIEDGIIKIGIDIAVFYLKLFIGK